jgi:hypothetical protein
LNFHREWWQCRAAAELADPELADPELADPQLADPQLADPAMREEVSLLYISSCVELLGQ